MGPDDLMHEVAKIRADGRRLPRSRVVERLSTSLSDFTAEQENQRFVEQLMPAGNYARLLLNSPDDDFQIVMVLWAPGRGSPIHDHSGTLGVVSSMVGRTREIKYKILQRHGSEVVLVPTSDLLIVPGRVTPIFPEDDMQLHLMANETSQWTATIHVYLTAIHKYHQYAQQSDQLYRSTPIDLWRHTEASGAQ